MGILHTAQSNLWLMWPQRVTELDSWRGHLLSSGGSSSPQTDRVNLKSFLSVLGQEEPPGLSHKSFRFLSPYAADSVGQCDG